MGSVLISRRWMRVFTGFMSMWHLKPCKEHANFQTIYSLFNRSYFICGDKGRSGLRAMSDGEYDFLNLVSELIIRTVFAHCMR